MNNYKAKDKNDINCSSEETRRINTGRIISKKNSINRISLGRKHEENKKRRNF